MIIGQLAFHFLFLAEKNFLWLLISHTFRDLDRKSFFNESALYKVMFKYIEFKIYFIFF